MNVILKYGILVLLFSLMTGLELLIAQEDVRVQTMESGIRDKIEEIAAGIDRELDYSELVIDLSYFAANPLNLNSATLDDLHKLGLLNDMQIYHLLAYRETYGYLVSEYELQAIDGFEASDIQNLMYFVKIAPVKAPLKLSPANVMKYGKHNVLLRYQRILQEKEGFRSFPDSSIRANPNSFYIGNADKYLLRYGFNYSNRIRLGLTMEKDPGEVFLRKNVPDTIHVLTENKIKNGFDFYSGHITLNDIGQIKIFTLGDYQLRFGQGLTLWGGLAFGKSADVSGVKKYGTGISPYTSADENRFFRGAATTINLGKFDLTAFYSKNSLDANLISDSSASKGLVSSITETGYHRTTNEIIKKDVLEMSVVGGNIKFTEERFQIGLTGFYSGFSYPISTHAELYHKFDFFDSTNLNMGIDFSYLFNGYQVFGELAMSKNMGLAGLIGFTTHIHPRIAVSLLYRNFGRDYHNYFSNAFSESNTYNESGIYTGLKILLLRNLSFSFYLDRYSFPWLKYLVDQPSIGNSILVQSDYTPNQDVSLNFRYKYKSKQKSAYTHDEHLKELLNISQHSFRFNIDYVVTKNVLMRNRLEYLVNANTAGEKANGYLVFHDVKWDLNAGLGFFFRYAVFDTDTYNERIYAYENDLLYAFSVPAYYYKGNKGVFMIRYQIKNYLACWLRYSHLWVKNKTSQGSGLDYIDGNNKSEIKLQLILKIKNPASN
ncbi:MAG: helix-hairpin-helix domain-containing protein [Bacteroidales bacterium]|nr:helix-hairpin-helix domain-containing protein [Bacteroidales bacterium]MCF8405219.1 helix-hairpin-helix domain-containing protein [Bacteroidales bacterium]